MAKDNVVGTVVYKLKLDTNQFETDVKKMGKNAQNAFSSISGIAEKSTKKVEKAWSVAASLVSSIVDRTYNKIAATISNSIDGAVSRVDTLNNANIVFEAMGYAANDVGKSIDSLSDYLNGLPTSMTDAVNGVQLLSASFGGINRGTDYFIAMNDAALAFGATSEQASNAITQLSQLSLEGPLDAETWNSLRDAGFGPVFAAMAQEANMTVGELKEDFGAKGTKSVQDFLDTLIRLDKDGTSSMESLSNLAKANTNGIATAMENVQNRVNKAVGTVIDAIGQSNISGAINQFSSQFGKLGNAVAATITGQGDSQTMIQDFVNGISESITAVLPQLGELTGKILPILLQSFAQILPALVQGGIDMIINFVNQISSIIPSVLPQIIQAIIDVFLTLSNPENLSKILRAAIDLLMSLVEALPTVLQALIEALPTIIENIVTFLTENLPILLEAAVQLFMSLVDALPTVLQSLLGVLPTIISTITGFLLRPDTIMMIINAAIKMFFALVDAIPTIIRSLADALPNIIISIVDFLTNPDTIGMILGAAVTLFFALVDAVPRILGALLESFGHLVGGLWNGITAMFGKFAENFGDFIGGIFKGAINGVIAFIEGFINTPIGIINGFIDIINGAFGWVGVNLGQISKVSLPRLYTGGIIPATMGGMPIIAGDGGEDEWVVPESKMASLIDQVNNGNGTAGGDTYNIYVNGVFTTSPEARREVADQIVEAIEQNNRRRFSLA